MWNLEWKSDWLLSSVSHREEQPKHHAEEHTLNYFLAVTGKYSRLFPHVDFGLDPGPSYCTGTKIAVPRLKIISPSPCNNLALFCRLVLFFLTIVVAVYIIDSDSEHRTLATMYRNNLGKFIHIFPDCTAPYIQCKLWAKIHTSIYVILRITQLVQGNSK